MQKRMMVGVGIAIAVIMFPMLAVANPKPIIGVIPDSIDFGEVDIGDSATKGLLITNFNGHTLEVYSITFEPGSSDAFMISNPPVMPLLIPTTSTHELAIVFTPTVEGEVFGTLTITSNDLANPSVQVNFKGTGAADSQTTIEDILAFFDAGVEAGTIEGRGRRHRMKRINLRIFKFKLLLAAMFIDRGWDRATCKMLWHLYALCDGQRRPRDLIVGEDVPELNTMILSLLNCERTRY